MLDLRHDFFFIGLFFSLSASCMPSVMMSETQQSFVSLRKPVEAGGLVPMPCGLSSLLSLQTVMLIARNPSSEHQEASRKKMEFISLLLTSWLLSPASLRERSVSLS